MLFYDADGCYDRIPPSLAEIALRRAGSPKEIANTHTKVQRQMKHHVKNGVGVSKGFMMFAPIIGMIMLGACIQILQGPIGGVGQGGGGSPISWLALLLMLIQAYKKRMKELQLLILLQNK